MNWYFSTGKLRFGDVGAANLTDVANGLGIIEDISIEINRSKEELRQASWISDWPVDVALTDATGSLKFNTSDMDPNLAARLTGATVTTAGGVQSLSITGSSKPGKFRLEIDVQDNTGTTRTIIVYCAYSLKYTASWKRKGYASTPIELEFIPDSNNNVLLMPFAPAD